MTSRPMHGHKDPVPKDPDAITPKDTDMKTFKSLKALLTHVDTLESSHQEVNSRNKELEERIIELEKQIKAIIG